MVENIFSDCSKYTLNQEFNHNRVQTQVQKNE